MTVTLSRSQLGLPELYADSAQPLAATCLTQPQILELCAYRGDSGRFRVTVTEADGTTPIDISSATWDADIRKSADATVVAGTFTVVPVAAVTNAVDVILTAAVSATLDDSPYVWDLEMTMGTEVTTLLVGPLVVTKDVSRPL
jgi:hypothetical protein